VHASLLPRWRGAAPIQRAIEAGDRQTGVTIMQMDAGLDSGPMLRSRALPIGPDETGGRLHDRLAELGAQLAVETLEDLSRGLLRPEPQPCAGITYAAKISRADAHLDWNESAQRLADRIRAFDPSPGCVSALASRPHEPIKIWAARAQPIAAGGADPGVPVRTDSGALEVACGQGRLALLELQRAGARRQTAQEFLRGRPIAAGDRFIHTGP
jgi:methionyl-tRNA formyltransferase